jgi:hypothetical protein
MPNAGVPPFERYYMSQTSMAAVDTAAIGSWEQFRAVFTTPWTIFSIGVKPFPLGTGMNLNAKTRAEAFLAVTPYGPFRFLYAIWLGRSRFLESWATTPDGGLKNDFFQGLCFTYDNGPLSMGWLGLIRNYHADAGVTGVGLDDNTLFNIVYMKYNNGRFFANSEYAWINVDRYYVGALPLYIEAYNFMVESGFTVGPAKLSAAYFLSSGPVLNDPNPTKVRTGMAINEPALEPYQYLMFTTYGGGNNCPWGTGVAFSSREEGMMSNAYAFTARLDYAVASNLNVWGSYMWAHRLERAGILGGQFDETDSLADPGTILWNGPFTPPQTTRFFDAQVVNLGNAAWATHQPYVDDGFIGWEANIGVDWKLLEGLTFNMRYAYWQPGEWFEQAYQAIMMTVGGAITRDGLLTGRDAINAFEGKLVIDF